MVPQMNIEDQDLSDLVVSCFQVFIVVSFLNFLSLITTDSSIGITYTGDGLG